MRVGRTLIEKRVYLHDEKSRSRKKLENSEKAREFRKIGRNQRSRRNQEKQKLQAKKVGGIYCSYFNTIQNSKKQSVDENNTELLITQLAEFRVKLREELKSGAEKKKLWGLVDEIRDTLPRFGVNLKVFFFFCI